MSYKSTERYSFAYAKVSGSGSLHGTHSKSWQSWQQIWQQQFDDKFTGEIVVNVYGDPLAGKAKRRALNHGVRLEHMFDWAIQQDVGIEEVLARALDLGWRE
jgi:hypothetical protein